MGTFFPHRDVFIFHVYLHQIIYNNTSLRLYFQGDFHKSDRAKHIFFFSGLNVAEIRGLCFLEVLLSSLGVVDVFRFSVEVGSGCNILFWGFEAGS